MEQKMTIDKTKQSDADSTSVLEMLCVMEFCEEYKVQLQDISITTENGRPERAYSFNDGLGYYTIDAIRKSIQKEEI